jgi:hypothetical protein
MSPDALPGLIHFDRAAVTEPIVVMTPSGWSLVEGLDMSRVWDYSEGTWHGKTLYAGIDAAPKQASRRPK